MRSYCNKCKSLLYVTYIYVRFLMKVIFFNINNYDKWKELSDATRIYRKFLTAFTLHNISLIKKLFSSSSPPKSITNPINFKMNLETEYGHYLQHLLGEKEIPMDMLQFYKLMNNFMIGMKNRTIKLEDYTDKELDSLFNKLIGKIELAHYNNNNFIFIDDKKIRLDENNLPEMYTHCGFFCEDEKSSKYRTDEMTNTKIALIRERVIRNRKYYIEAVHSKISNKS